MLLTGAVVHIEKTKNQNTIRLLCVYFRRLFRIAGLVLVTTGSNCTFVLVCLVCLPRSTLVSIMARFVLLFLPFLGIVFPLSIDADQSSTGAGPLPQFSWDRISTWCFPTFATLPLTQDQIAYFSKFDMVDQCCSTLLT